jgi:hypothetical protein
MYTGTLIADLMRAVERVEGTQVERETAELERLYLAECGGNVVEYQENLVGVA